MRLALPRLSAVEFRNLKIPKEVTDKYVPVVLESCPRDVSKVLQDVLSDLEDLSQIFYRLNSGDFLGLSEEVKESAQKFVRPNEVQKVVEAARFIAFVFEGSKGVTFRRIVQELSAGGVPNLYTKVLEGVEDWLDYLEDLPSRVQSALREYGFDLGNRQEIIDHVAEESGLPSSRVLELFGGNYAPNDIKKKLTQLYACLLASSHLIEFVLAYDPDNEENGPHRFFPGECVRGYHATVALKSILSEGFKNTNMVELRGLGGGTSGGKVSITLSKDHAIRIASALKFAAHLANGSIGGADIVRWLKHENLLGEMERVLTSAFGLYHETLKVGGISIEEFIQSLFKGILYKVWDKFSDPDDLEKCEVVKDMSDGVKILACSDKDEVDSAKYAFLKALFHVLERVTEVYDPTFFGGTWENFKKLDPSNIGVVVVEFDPEEAETEYNSVEYEYRVPPDKLEILGYVDMLGAFHSVR